MYIYPNILKTFTFRGPETLLRVGGGSKINPSEDWALQDRSAQYSSRKGKSRSHLVRLGWGENSCLEEEGRGWLPAAQGQ